MVIRAVTNLTDKGHVSCCDFMTLKTWKKVNKPINHAAWWTLIRDDDILHCLPYIGPRLLFDKEEWVTRKVDIPCSLMDVDLWRRYFTLSTVFRPMITLRPRLFWPNIFRRSTSGWFWPTPNPWRNKPASRSRFEFVIVLWRFSFKYDVWETSYVRTMDK